MDWRLSENLEVIPKEKLKEAAFTSTKIVLHLLSILAKKEEGMKTSEVGLILAQAMMKQDMPDEARMLQHISLRLKMENM